LRKRRFRQVTLVPDNPLAAMGKCLYFIVVPPFSDAIILYAVLLCDGGSAKSTVATGSIRYFLQMLILSCVTRQDLPHVPLQEMGISIRPLDTRCLISTCKIPTNSP